MEFFKMGTFGGTFPLRFFLPLLDDAIGSLRLDTVILSL